MFLTLLAPALAAPAAPTEACRATWAELEPTLDGIDAAWGISEEAFRAGIGTLTTRVACLAEVVTPEARGVGRVQQALDVLAALEPHERLLVRAETDNAYNPHALALQRRDGTPIGYVPDYLANELAAVGGRSHQLEIELLESRRVTFAPAPAVYRVLCRYACPPELGRALFTSDSYRPLSAAQPSSSSAV